MHSFSSWPPHFEPTHTTPRPRTSGQHTMKAIADTTQPATDISVRKFRCDVPKYAHAHAYACTYARAYACTYARAYACDYTCSYAHAFVALRAGAVVSKPIPAVRTSCLACGAIPKQPERCGAIVVGYISRHVGDLNRKRAAKYRLASHVHFHDIAPRTPQAILHTQPGAAVSAGACSPAIVSIFPGGVA